MASGMEKMLASLLGVEPEVMRETITEAIGLLTTISERFESIESKLDKLLDKDKGFCQNDLPDEIEGIEHAEETGH